MGNPAGPGSLKPSSFSGEYSVPSPALTRFPVLQYRALAGLGAPVPLDPAFGPQSGLLESPRQRWDQGTGELRAGPSLSSGTSSALTGSFHHHQRDPQVPRPPAADPLVLHHVPRELTASWPRAPIPSPWPLTHPQPSTEGSMLVMGPQAPLSMGGSGPSFPSGSCDSGINKVGAGICTAAVVTGQSSAGAARPRWEGVWMGSREGADRPQP